MPASYARRGRSASTSRRLRRGARSSSIAGDAAYVATLIGGGVRSDGNNNIVGNGVETLLPLVPCVEGVGPVHADL
jgi:hypothetical protein